VARDRLLVVGISRGGKGALDFVVRHGAELGAIGVAVCCPEHIESLPGALNIAPVYLFHGETDAVVQLDHGRESVYNALADRDNFRWVRIHESWTLGKKHHNCWTELFRHPDLYEWLAMLRTELNYARTKAVWPAFDNLRVQRSVRSDLSPP
jgi:predicted peptidase